MGSALPNGRGTHRRTTSCGRACLQDERFLMVRGRVPSYSVGVLARSRPHNGARTLEAGSSVSCRIRSRSARGTYWIAAQPRKENEP